MARKVVANSEISVANRLAGETSPYLLQHADNPVDWFPWGDAAFDLARREDRPILLSIGYAACHWCHVMAHESFEDPAIADLMNRLFVNIKVDREERPDVDGIYMQAIQAMTGQGGWPMTVFLTPSGDPFYGGTYFPPADRHGMPSFRRILQSVADAYRTKRGAIEQTALTLRQVYAAAAEQAIASGELATPLLDRAYQGITRQYDRSYGGFGGAPKFPQAMTLEFLLRYWRRTGTADALAMVTDSFRYMARGGLYDQVGGGFHRYTVDGIWLVPHFEKMLYDNALLVRLGVHLYQATQDSEIRTVVDESLDWLAREMTSPEGGWYSSLDADSEGHEGIFYVWDDAELDRVLGADAPAVRQHYGVKPGGNFEGHHILFVADPSAVLPAGTKERLLNARRSRVRPGRDDKILAAWNGLMLRAVAEAARAFDRADYRARAVAAGEFLRREMVTPDGRVLRSWTNGQARIGGFLDDHAAVALGFVALYELTFDHQWLASARDIMRAINQHFWDETTRAFYDTADDAEALITRPRDITDNAVPSGTSLTVDLLLHLGDLVDDRALRERGEWVLTTLAEPAARHPLAFGYLLQPADMAINGAVEVAVVGDPAASDFRALSAALGQVYVPAPVVAGGPPTADSDVVLLNGRPTLGGAATAYVCRQYVCDRPTIDAGELVTQLGRSGSL
jgi:uncharacterized protein